MRMERSSLERDLYEQIQAYERDEKDDGVVVMYDRSDDLMKYLMKHGMQRLAMAVQAFPFVDVPRFVRSVTSETENHVLTHLVRVAPTLIKHTSQPPFFVNGTSNSCVFKQGDRYFVNCRVVNYVLDRERANHFILPNGIDYFQSTNVLLEMSSDLKGVVSEKVFENDEEGGPVRGLEDVRVLVEGDKKYYIATIFNQGQLMMSHGEYDTSAPKIERHPIGSPYGRRVEKNWCMFAHNGDVRFVYQWYPLEIGKVVSSKLQIVLRRQYDIPILKRVKGSSCGVHDPVTKSIWFLVHFHTDNEFRQYYHMFILLDPEALAIQKISCPFTFEMEKIEFGMGLVVEASRIVITHTVFDATARVSVFDRKELETLVLGPHTTMYDMM